MNGKIMEEKIRTPENEARFQLFIILPLIILPNTFDANSSELRTTEARSGQVCREHYWPITFSRRKMLCAVSAGTLKTCSLPLPVSGMLVQLPGCNVVLHSAP